LHAGISLGHLFRKFFACIWLPQVAVIVVIVSSLWLTASRPDRTGPVALTNRADTVLDEAVLPVDEPGRRDGPPWVPVLITLAASLATALALAWYVARPIRSLRTAFDAVAAGDLNARVAPTIGSRHDELADLGRDFDRMADRLQASMNGRGSDPLEFEFDAVDGIEHILSQAADHAERIGSLEHNALGRLLGRKPTRRIRRRRALREGRRDGRERRSKSGANAQNKAPQVSALHSIPPPRQCGPDFIPNRDPAQYGTVSFSRLRGSVSAGRASKPFKYRLAM
jgi:HAMP domain-containing protein